MVTKKKQDFHLKVTITIGKNTLDNVICDIFLPEKVTDPIELCFHPTKEQMFKLINQYEFSLYGEIQDTKIQAKKAYFKGGEPLENYITANPFDLKITKKCNAEEEFTTFWLTPSYILSVFISKPKKFELILEGNIQLTFDEHYRYLKSDKDETTMFSELVVKWKTGFPDKDISILDDILLLISFAARQSCRCLGWEQFNFSSCVKYYRRDKAIPNDTKDHNHDTVLIEFTQQRENYFEDYIKTAYKTFTEFNQDEKAFIRQTLHIIKITYNDDGHTIEDAFIRLFSAIETLVTFFRKKHNLEIVIPTEEWPKIRKKLKECVSKCLKTEGNLDGNKNKEKRKLIYQNLDGLNRISFSVAFNRFCEQYAVNLDDLWPVVCDRKDGISLSDIRNKLVHGETFAKTNAEFLPLRIANEHLKWTVERMLISVLGWPVKKSAVAVNHTTCSSDEKNGKWQEYRQILTCKDGKHIG